MKIRIIDLLNMISKGEEVPDRIAYQNVLYYKNNDGFTDYYESDCFDILLEKINNTNRLNDEVEIIEDTPKKIEKLDEWQFNKSEEDIPHFELAQKVNEIIEYINKGEENE